jgi:serine/threonine protein kinase
MAPEIVKGEGYNFSCDVYSFGILLWEICTLEKPFQKYRTLEELEQKVVQEGERPSLRAKLFSCSCVLQGLLTMCWYPDHYQRPTFESIAEIFIDEILVNQYFRDTENLALAVVPHPGGSLATAAVGQTQEPARRRQAPRRRGSTSSIIESTTTRRPAVTKERSVGRIYESWFSSSSRGSFFGFSRPNHSQRPTFKSTQAFVKDEILVNLGSPAQRRQAPLRRGSISSIYEFTTTRRPVTKERIVGRTYERRSSSKF